MRDDSTATRMAQMVGAALRRSAEVTEEARERAKMAKPKPSEEKGEA